MRILVPLLLSVFVACAPLSAADLPSKAEVKALAGLSEAWLRQQQQDDGSYLPGDRFKLGITTVVVLGLLENGVAKDDPAVAKAADFIKTFIQPDGGIYNPTEGLANYTTSLGLRVLVGADKADKELITNAQNYLLGLQNTDKNSKNYGGIGYGQRGKGNEDLSNTAMAVEALVQSGMSPEDPALQRALEFISRCQNLSSTNDMPWAGQDGGAVYSPDSSMAQGSFHDGDNVDRPESAPPPTSLKSYGSMSYALITSFIYLDMNKKDPRLQAALNWVQHNYQFEANPGMPEGQTREGLFYYYQAMAKTFHLLEKTSVEVDGSTKGDWRTDLFSAIQGRAQVIKNKEGTPVMALWINDQPRWAEGIPHLTGAYMLTSLARIHNSLP